MMTQQAVQRLLRRQHLLVPLAERLCSYCGGDGGYTCQVPSPGRLDGYTEAWESCPECGGSGHTGARRIAELQETVGHAGVYQRPPTPQEREAMLFAECYGDDTCNGLRQLESRLRVERLVCRSCTSAVEARGTEVTQVERPTPSTAVECFECGREF